MTTDKRVLVTGASGFAGTWLVSELTVLGFDVVAGSHRRPYLPVPDMPAASSSVTMPIEDLDAVIATLEDGAIGSVVHAAGIATTAAANARPLDAVTANVVGTANVLEAARILGLDRVLVLSSGSVYGWTPGDGSVLTEDRATGRASAGMYGATKLAAENIGRAYRSLGVDCASIRTSRIFGAGSRATDFIIDDLVQQALDGGPLVLGPAAAVGVDYTYVRDLAGAVAALLAPPTLRHDVYNVSGGRSVTGFAIARALAALRPGLRWQRAAEDRGSTFPYARPRFSIRRIRDELGWAPRYPLAAALEDYLRHAGGSPPSTRGPAHEVRRAASARGCAPARRASHP